MTKQKTPSRGKREVRARLQTLRDDCRRHDAPPVKLSKLTEEIDGAAPIMTIRLSGADSEVAKSKAFLDRLGEIILEHPEVVASIKAEAIGVPERWDARRAVAMRLLLDRVPALTVCEVRSAFVPMHLEGDVEAERHHLCAQAPDMIDREQSVPDVRLAIAEAIDVMLEEPVRKRRTADQVNDLREKKKAEALLAIQRDPGASDAKVAEAIGVDPSWYSRNLTNDPVIVRARQANTVGATLHKTLCNGRRGRSPVSAND